MLSIGGIGKNCPNILFRDFGEIILKTAVGREKAVQAIGVHRELKNGVVTFWVMSHFFHFLGASRGCADFRDPTAVFRIIDDFIVSHPLRYHIQNIVYRNS